MYITQYQQYNILYKQYISKYNISFNLHMFRVPQLLLKYFFLSCFTTVPAQINQRSITFLLFLKQFKFIFIFSFAIDSNSFFRIVSFFITTSTYWRCQGRINYRRWLSNIVWQSLRLDFVIVRTVSSNQCSFFSNNRYRR